MALRYQQYYIVKVNDNLGDPNCWNLRFRDIDLRLNIVESINTRVDDVVDELTNLGITRINTTFDPLIAEAQIKVDQLSTLIRDIIDGGVYA